MGRNLFDGLGLPAILVCIVTASFPAIVSAEQPGTDFHKGLWDVAVTGSFIPCYREPHDNVVTTAISLDYYVRNNLALSVSTAGYYFDQPTGEDTGGADLGIGGRWHFANFDRLTLYGDCRGAGFYADHNVPPTATHFNFTLRIGPGATFRIAENVHVMAGARYFHLSNADIRGVERNPGLDGIEYYGGAIFTW
jgi:opacity protein-like surface antigen